MDLKAPSCTSRVCTRAAVLLILSCSLFAPPAQAQATFGWSTSGTKILTPGGGEFVISGVNWYGFETTTSVAHGLYARDYKAVIDQMKQYGYNTIRLAFSNQVWETNPIPAAGSVSACPACAGKRARDIMALIVNYAGSVGLHVILDNHRSTAGDSAQENGLWYTAAYPESAWIADWLSVQSWLHGVPQTLGGTDTVTVNTFALDGAPTVLGFDLRNEPHTPSGAYSSAATWGLGDGIDPLINPNPNPFAPACVASSTCHDWRLAAERASTSVLGHAAANGWEYPLLFVEGVSMYPQAGGSMATGPYEYYWWGGNLLGVNGNATNAGAPVLTNAGGSATSLGAPVYDQVLYSIHDYGPNLYVQPWFNGSTCYASGCSASSLADTWKKYWAHLNVDGGLNPVWPGHAGYPWGNTGHHAITQGAIYIGEFGTGNTDADMSPSAPGTQGHWMTSIVNFIQSSYLTSKTVSNDSGVAVSNLHWTYWAVNGEDSYGVLASNYAALASARKEYSYLCFIQQGLLAVPMGSQSGTCSFTGTLPLPDGSSPVPVPAPAAPAGVVATAGNAQVALTWSPSAGATSYTVSSATASGGPYQFVAAVSSTSVTQTGLVNGTTRYYVVTASGAGGQSPNSAQVSATPVAPPPPPPPPQINVVSVWWPVDGVTVSGTQPFKARIDTLSPSAYALYWQVDGGALNMMIDNSVGGVHKEASVSLAGWTWRGRGPYTVTFVAKDRIKATIAQKSVVIYVAP